ncbi:MAG: dienelactone hydrolase [Chthoniobacteraceae bacterium]|nr:dienelactone hydrolase [Chthoniobacteraceae bacterium]
MKTLGCLPFLTLFLQTSMHSVQAAPAIEQRNESFLSGGKTIHVETFAPAGNGRFPAVLVLHTSVGTLVGKSQLELFSKQLAAQGNVAFLVRYFDRTGTHYAGDDKINELAPVWIETVHDTVSFAAAHAKVRPGAIGIFGYSLGAYLGVAESSNDPRVKALVEIAGGILTRYKGKIDRLPPLLSLHGDADERVSVSNAFELQKLARQLGGNPQIHIYKGEGHRLSPAAASDASARALRFLERHLSRH